jgi:hypothetical protein
MTAPKPKPKPDPEPDPPEPGPDDEPDTIDKLIAVMHYHVSDGNCPTELPKLLEMLWGEIKALDERMRAPPIPIGRRP